MKLHYFYPVFLLTIVFIVVACKKTVEITHGDLIVIDVTKDYPEKKIVLQDVAEVEYIPLETTDDFLWNGWTITSFTDKYIMNADTQSGTVLIFGRDGKVLKNFNRLGNNGEEYTAYSEFLLDENNEEIFVNDRNKEKIFVYDLDGTFKRVIDYIEDMHYNSLKNFDKSTLIGYNKVWANDVNNEYFLMSKTTGEILKKVTILPMGEKLNERVIKEEGYNTMTVAFMYYPHLSNYPGFTLNEISNDTIFKINVTFEPDPFIIQSPSRITMKPEIFLIYYSENSEYILLYTINKEFDIDNMKGFDTKFLVYDKKEGKVYGQNFVNNDFVPESGFTFAPNVNNFNKNSYAYIIEASHLVEAYENDELKGKLKEIAANLEEDDNPVLAVIKFK